VGLPGAVEALAALVRLAEEFGADQPLEELAHRAAICTRRPSG
jgi:hypothetical protein